MEQDIFGAILISFVISVILCPIVIPYLQKLKFGQYIRKEGPKSHQTKMGTPTMGGLIGFLDDYIKVVMKRNLGLRPLTKFILQFVVCTIFIVYILGIFEDTSIYIPFFHKYLELGRPVYAGLIYITVLGTVNGANLTDGIDGLATGVTIIITVFFTVVAWAYNTGLLPITSAVLGALMGFFLFNVYPAKVFMGDTGSLALGGFVAGIAVWLKMPLFLLLVAVVYFIEALSVIVQVIYFKITGGKRLFKMTPIHHHFELCGWSETRIMAVFAVVTALTCLIAYKAI